MAGGNNNPEGNGELVEQQPAEAPQNRITADLFNNADGREAAVAVSPAADLEETVEENILGNTDVAAEEAAGEAEVEGPASDYLKRCESAVKRRKEIEQKAESPSLEQSVKQYVQEARTKAIAAVYNEVKGEAQRRFEKYQEADRANILVKIYRAVKRALLNEKKAAKPNSVEEVITAEGSDILRAIVSDISAKAKQKKEELERKKAYLVTKKKDYQDKADSYEAEIRGHLAMYEEGKARIDDAANQIEKLKKEKDKYHARLIKNQKDREADALYRNSCTNLNTQQIELKTAERGIRSINRDLSRMKTTIQDYLANVDTYESAEDICDDEVENIDGGITELTKILQDDKERASLIEVFETVAQSKDIQVVMQKVYEPAIESIVNIFRRVTEEPSDKDNILKLKADAFKNYSEKKRTMNSDAYEWLKDRFS